MGSNGWLFMVFGLAVLFGFSSALEVHSHNDNEVADFGPVKLRPGDVKVEIAERGSKEFHICIRRCVWFPKPHCYYIHCHQPWWPHRHYPPPSSSPAPEKSPESPDPPKSSHPPPKSSPAPKPSPAEGSGTKGSPKAPKAAPKAPTAPAPKHEHED